MGDGLKKWSISSQSRQKLQFKTRINTQQSFIAITRLQASVRYLMYLWRSTSSVAQKPEKLANALFLFLKQLQAKRLQLMCAIMARESNMRTFQITIILSWFFSNGQVTCPIRDKSVLSFGT